MELPEKYIKNCVNLDYLGLDQLGFKKEDALPVLEYSKKNNIAVLGGDVLDNEKGVYRHNYDNWYLDKGDSDTWENFVLNTVNKAKSYIEDYQNENAIFVLVLCDKEGYPSEK